MILGQVIKERRKELGITQRDLAKTVGISTNALVDIEKERSYPTWRTMAKIADNLRLRILLIPEENL